MVDTLTSRSFARCWRTRTAKVESVIRRMEGKRSRRAGRAAIGAPGLLHDYITAQTWALAQVPAELSDADCVRSGLPSASARGAAEDRHARVSAPASC